MKNLLLALVAFAAIAPLADAATPVKKTSKNPALAQTWSGNAKTYEGKKVTTYAIEHGELGGVSSDSPYAVVPLTTGTANGEAGDEIAVVVPTAQLQGFISSLAAKKAGKGGAFGGKVQYATVSGTFVTLKGEPALVIGEVTEAVKAIKPSELLATQRAAGGAAQEAPAEESASAAKPDKKKKK